VSKESYERVLQRRIQQLNGWTLHALLEKRDELGLKMDPTRTYSLPVEIAKEELRRIEHPKDDYPPADVAGVPFGSNTQYVNAEFGEDALPGDGLIRPYNIQTSSGYFIYEVILPEVLKHFFSKNADYGDQHRTGLGLRAEFVGLHRKFAKLKSYFWDGQEMNHEDGQEMLYDVIGSCFLMLDLMAQPAPAEPINRKPF